MKSPLLLPLAALLVAAFLSGCATTSPQLAPGALEVEATPLPLQSERAKLERQGPNRFQVKCGQVQAVAVKQRRDYWCWAACAEMLHRYSGADITQEEIAQWIGKQTEAGGEAEAAGKFEIWLAMNPDLKLEMVRRDAAWQKNAKPNTYTVGLHANFVNLNDVINSSTDPTGDITVQELSSGNPLVLGLKGTNGGSGHVVIVYGVEYSRKNPKGEAIYRDLSHIFYRFSHRYAIHKLYIIDPQPLEGEQLLQELQGDAFAQQKGFVIGKAEARNQLEAYIKVWMPTPEEIESRKARSRPLK